MPKRPFVTILLALCALSQEPDSARITRVEHSLPLAGRLSGEAPLHLDIVDRMAHYRVPGVSVAVIDHGVIALAKGYGFRDREGKLPVNTDTLFEAGSISKPVAAAGALSLVEQHKLDLDEDVNQKLKSWKVPENEFTAKEKVTLRRLLSHSAGLTVHGFPGYAAGAPVPTVPQVLDGAKPANTPAVRVDTVPGTKWRYSGGGYTVMQLLVSDVTGRAFPSFLHGAVLSKAGMTRSTYEQPLPEKLHANAAIAYDRKGAPIPGRYHTYPEMAAAGLWTTASDLARFAIAIMESSNGKSERVLSHRMTVEMLKKQSGGYGLGFDVEGPTPRFSHGGVDEGFEAMLICFPDLSKGAVVMTNAQGGLRLANEILFSIAAEYGWPADFVPKVRTAVSLKPDVLARYAGQYSGDQIGKIEIAATAKGLQATAGDMSVTFYPESEKRFFTLTDEFPILDFTIDQAGKVTGFKAGPFQAKRD